jgi:hypothetical protein
MSIKQIDAIKLWGLACGQCSYPECKDKDLIKFFKTDNPTLLGEMAHVIAKSAKGARGQENNIENNSYENLILLCPTHHTMIDKAPESFTESILKSWKTSHESHIKQSTLPKVIHDRATLFMEIFHLLSENYQIWRQYGPESEEAKSNPGSNAITVWSLKKLSDIVPNNKKIVNLLEQYKNFIQSNEFNIVYEFKVHAEGFELNCYVKKEGVKRFPQVFREWVDNNV